MPKTILVGLSDALQENVMAGNLRQADHQRDCLTGHATATELHHKQLDAFS